MRKAARIDSCRCLRSPVRAAECLNGVKLAEHRRPTANTHTQAASLMTASERANAKTSARELINSILRWPHIRQCARKTATGPSLAANDCFRAAVAFAAAAAAARAHLSPAQPQAMRRRRRHASAAWLMRRAEAAIVLRARVPGQLSRRCQPPLAVLWWAHDAVVVPAAIVAAAARQSSQ